MKILFIIPEEYQGKHWGGVTTYTILLARKLKKIGHDISIVTPGRKNETIVDDGVLIYKIQHPPPSGFFERLHDKISRVIWPEILYRIHWAWDIYRFVKTHGPFAIVEAPEWGASTIFLPFCRHFHVVVRLHRSWYQYKKDNALPITTSDRIRDGLERWCILTATGITSPTKYMVDQYPILGQILRFRRCPEDIIPNGITITKKRTRANVLPYPYILTVGRIETGKGSLILLNAFIVMHKDYPTLRLVFIGEDTNVSMDGYTMSYTAYLRKRATKARVSRRVIFISKQPNEKMEKYYSGCLCYVVPSRGNENMSVALLEAMAAGKAIIGSCAGGTPEVIIRSKNGLLFEQNNVHELADALRYMMSHKKFRELCEQNSRFHRGEYGVDLIARKTLRFYEQVMLVQ